MYNHAPKNYKCPMCSIARGIENESVYTKQADIVYQDKSITAFVASHWWPNNEGHIIVISNKHFENIYDLPINLSDKIHALEKQVAIALKKIYNCDGVSSRQHNEHAGDQDVWHYHLHIFPRYKNDNLYSSKKSLSMPKRRKFYATKLKRYFSK